MVLFPLIVKNKLLHIRLNIIKELVKNIKKESMLLRFLRLIFLSKGLYTAILSGKVFHITNKAPKDAIPVLIKILNSPFYLIFRRLIL